MGKPTLSFTKLNMLWKCGIQYDFRYVQGKKFPPGVGLIRGIAVHETIEYNLRNKMSQGGLLPEEEIREMAHDVFVEEWGKIPVKLTEEEKIEGLKKVKGKNLDDSVKLSVFHRNALAPEIEPKDVEKFWKLECDGYPYDLTGKIDIQEESRLRDTKTAAKSPAKNIADVSDQLTAYALAMFVIDKKYYDVQFDYLINLKSGIKYAVVESKREMGHFEAFKRRFENACIVLEKGVFLPAQSDTWQCSPNWCGFHDICPYVHSVQI